MTQSPWWNNAAKADYDNMEHMAVDGMNAGKPQKYSPSFVNYVDGIYVGYKFDETAHDVGMAGFDHDSVAQLYVGKSDGKVSRPAKELKGFTKVFLKAGESRTVTIPLDDKAFRYFNVKTNRFEVEGGEYQVMIGASAAEPVRLLPERSTVKFRLPLHAMAILPSTFSTSSRRVISTSSSLGQRDSRQRIPLP